MEQIANVPPSAPTNPAQRTYLRRETVVSAAINAVLSAVFTLLAFGGEMSIGWRALAFDALPQSFAIALMGSLVPALLARRAIGAGRLPGGGRHLATGAIVQAALRNALLAAVIGTALWAAALVVAGVETIAFDIVMAVKIAYGAVLGAIVTRIVLTRLLSAPADPARRA